MTPLLFCDCEGVPRAIQSAVTYLPHTDEYVFADTLGRPVAVRARRLHARIERELGWRVQPRVRAWGVQIAVMLEHMTDLWWRPTT